MVELLLLLEQKAALRILWALYQDRVHNFRSLQARLVVAPNTLNLRLKELRQAGLLQHQAAQKGYVLTKLGSELMTRLELLPAFANRWKQVQR